jgi:hypothetical protein
VEEPAQDASPDVVDPDQEQEPQEHKMDSPSGIIKAYVQSCALWLLQGSFWRLEKN